MKIIRRPQVRLSLALILISSMFSLAAPSTALGMSNDKSKEGSEQPLDLNKAGVAAEADSSLENECVKSPNIAYVLYSNSVSFKPEPKAEAGVLGPTKPISPEVFAVKTIVPRSLPALPPPPPAASTAPMTAGEKFNYFFMRSFWPPGPYVQSAVIAMINELPDNNEGKEDTVGDFFADSATRAARSIGNRAANNFFEKFALATIFKQDPRYHRSGHDAPGPKIKHALSRIVITQGDRSGDQFNISFLLGGLLGATVSNVWQKEDKQTVGKTLTRWATHIGFTAFSNVVREFVGGQ